MKKLLAILSTLVMALGMTTVAWAEGENVAEVNGTKYDTLAAAVEAAPDGGTVKVLKEITLSETLIVKKKLTLDLNGQTIKNTTDIWNTNTDSWSLISVQTGGDLTVTGNGTMAAKENDC